MTELTKIKSNAKVIENSKRMELEKAVTGFNMTMEILKKLKKVGIVLEIINVN